MIIVYLKQTIKTLNIPTKNKITPIKNLENILNNYPNIVIVWIPSNVGIPGNKYADILLSNKH